MKEIDRQKGFAGHYRDVAGLYLELYCTEHKLQRPLTVEHAADAASLFHQVILAHEEGLQAARDEVMKKVEREPSCDELFDVFIRRWKRENNLERRLDEDDVADVANAFLLRFQERPRD